jgi:hypothetical protein
MKLGGISSARKEYMVEIRKREIDSLLHDKRMKVIKDSYSRCDEEGFIAAVKGFCNFDFGNNPPADTLVATQILLKASDGVHNSYPERFSAIFARAQVEYPLCQILVWLLTNVDERMEPGDKVIENVCRCLLYLTYQSQSYFTQNSSMQTSSKLFWKGSVEEVTVPRTWLHLS